MTSSVSAVRQRFTSAGTWVCHRASPRRLARTRPWVSAGVRSDCHSLEPLSTPDQPAPTQLCEPHAANSENQSSDLATLGFMMDEFVAGLLTELVVRTSVRVGGAYKKFGERAAKDDHELATWFDTYRFTRTIAVPALPAALPEENLKKLLLSDACQAVLHELLAARLCAAPESHITELRALFAAAIHAPGPADPFANDLFDCFDGEIAALVGRLAGTMPDALPKLRQEAIGARIVAALHAIERHAAALDAAPDVRADQEFVMRYRSHVTREHGKLRPPDFEKRRLVPIAKLYVSPDIVLMPPPGVVAPKDAPPPCLNIDALADVIDRTVLLGAPGGGKTTTSNVLMHLYASDFNKRVPFLVTLRDFAHRQRSVVEHIELKLDTNYQCKPQPGLVGRLLLNGAAVVIFDGLDELLDASLREEVSMAIEHFAIEYPHVPILVTSRMVGYEEARLDDTVFSRYLIGGFDDERVKLYAIKWFRLQEGITAEGADAWAESFMAESEQVPDLRSNPLMLSLMCILYRGENSIPKSRAMVYDRCATLLFQQWDTQRGIHVELRAKHLVEPALRHLAFWLMTRERNETAVAERQLVAETALYFGHRGFETTEDATDAAKQFVHFCRGRAWVFSEAGTTSAGESLYTFTHRTFLEYFAASYLSSAYDSPEKLARKLLPRVARHEWDVVAELAIQIKDRSSERGAERAVTVMLAECSRYGYEKQYNVLSFVEKCFDGIEMPPPTIRRLTRDIVNFCLPDQIDPGHQSESLFNDFMRQSLPYRDVVHSEISSVIASRVSSADPARRISGFHLLISCDPNTFLLPANAQKSEFWQDAVSNYTDLYKSELVALGIDDPSLCHFLLRRELTTVGDVLDRSKNGLAMIFRVVDGPMGGHSWSPFMEITAGMFDGHDEFWSRKKAYSACEDLGKYLSERWIEPPWDLGKDYFNGHELEEIREPESAYGNTYVGATIAILIQFERMAEQSHRHRKSFQVLRGPLAGYINCRLNNKDSQLASLPLPDHIQSAVEAWARGTLNFDRNTTATTG
jgi:hypothetical protein